MKRALTSSKAKVFVVQLAVAGADGLRGGVHDLFFVTAHLAASWIVYYPAVDDASFVD